jgi:hypothetical protein
MGDDTFDIGNDNFEIRPARPFSSGFSPSSYEPLPTSRFPEIGTGPSSGPVADAAVPTAPVVVSVRPAASAPPARATPTTLPFTGEAGPRTLAGILGSLGLISLGVSLRLRRRRMVADNLRRSDAHDLDGERGEAPSANEEHVS